MHVTKTLHLTTTPDTSPSFSLCFWLYGGMGTAPHMHARTKSNAGRVTAGITKKTGGTQTALRRMGCIKNTKAKGGGWGRLLDFSDDAKCWQGFKFIACRSHLDTNTTSPQLTPSSSIPLKSSESPSRVRQRGADLGEGQGEGQPIGPVLTRSLCDPSCHSHRLTEVHLFFFKNLARRAPRSKASSSALHATRSPHSDLREIGREAGVAKAPSPFIYRR